MYKTMAKVECFARKFFSKSNFDSYGVCLPDFSLRTESLLSNMNIIPSMISAI